MIDQFIHGPSGIATLITFEFLKCIFHNYYAESMCIGDLIKSKPIFTDRFYP